MPDDRRHQPDDDPHELHRVCDESDRQRIPRRDVESASGGLETGVAHAELSGHGVAESPTHHRDAERRAAPYESGATGDGQQGQRVLGKLDHAAHREPDEGVAQALAPGVCTNRV
jgi:hypothetical protein